MKKLVIIALTFVALSANAQERKTHDYRRPNFTPQEVAELKTKRMVLDLDLTEDQQKQVAKINLENAKKRQERMATYRSKKEQDQTKPTKEERLKMKNDILDHQIETKRKMREILNDKQYEKWSENLKHKKDKISKRGRKHDRMRRH